MRPSERIDEMEIEITAKFAAMQVILMISVSRLFPGDEPDKVRRLIAEFDMEVEGQLRPELFRGLDPKKRARAAEMARAFASHMIGGLIVPE